MNQSLEFRETFLRRVRAPEAGGGCQLSDKRIKWAVLVIGGTVETQRRVTAQFVMKR